MIIILIIKFIDEWVSSIGQHLILTKLRLYVLINSIEASTMRNCHIHFILQIFLLFSYQTISGRLQILILGILLLLRSMKCVECSALSCHIHYVVGIILLLRELTLMPSVIVIIWSCNWTSNQRVIDSYSNYLILILLALIELYACVIIHLLRHTHFSYLWLIRWISLK